MTNRTMANLNCSRLVLNGFLVFAWSLCNVHIATAQDPISSSFGAADVPGSSMWTWGPYRPNLYFGIRPQVPKTLLLGMMWANGDNRTSMLSTLRDTCEQDDGMQGYGWTMYDTRTGGSQTIHDSVLHVDLTTDFFKTKDGLSWSVRITGVPRPDAPANLKTAFVFHVALEGDVTDERSVRCINQASEANELGANVRCLGSVPELGPIEIYEIGDAQNKIVQGPAVNSLTVSEDKIWQAKAVFTDAVNMASGDAMVVDQPGLGNMHFSQVVLEGPFSITYAFRSDAGMLLLPDTLNSTASRLNASFPSRVDGVFPRADPYKDEKYARFTQSLLSNLLGGLGFFYGDTKVDYSDAPEYEETALDFWVEAAAAMARAPITTTANASLLSHVPSRPFFPRGFLWDEGFHLLPVVEWDLDLAVSVLKSWLSRMDDNGWIEREQILGPEPRSKVPTEFQTQYPHYANPPTLSLLLTNIISKITKKSAYTGQSSKYITSAQEGQSLVNELVPLVTKHYNWLRRTLAGNFTAYPRPEGANMEGYRWKGRTPGLTLTSGLDDYPRAEPPHPGELHLDALGWVGAVADTLKQAAEYLGEDNSSVYGEQLEAVRHNIEALHWDATQSAYCDATIGGDGQYQTACHLGYISLMPLLLGHLNESHPNLPAVLDLLSDPDKLWSPHGLRSLSLTDVNYGQGDNYWRGAVWMNINVLAVLRLRDLGRSTSQGVRAHSLAADLRTRVVDTVYKSWEQTGFVWEQYNDKTGAGQRSRAFTGWTACVILLMGLNNDAADAPASAIGGASSWSIPIFSLIIVLILGLGLFRQKVITLFGRTVRRCRSWCQTLISSGGGRGRGRGRGEYMTIERGDDVSYSDTELDDLSRPTGGD